MNVFQLRVVQAEYGDCLILEYGDSQSPRFMLIDGGPKIVYTDHLKPELKKIRDRGGRLNRIIVSHVDDDHIHGILELLDELRSQIIDGLPQTINIDAFWHNTFEQTIGEGTDIEDGMKKLFGYSQVGSETYAVADFACYSIKQGYELAKVVKAHEIPINPETEEKTICAENLPEEIVDQNLTVQVMGPTQENLKKLRKEWLDWLEKQKKKEKSTNPFFEAMADGSYRNLSSIMILAEAEGKRMLLTGDGRGDHLIQGLEKAGQLDGRGEIFVDVLKLPHHGSEENVSRSFFDKVQAGTYVISANGKNGNPDFSTLTWLVESAYERGDQVEVLATNETSSTRKLIKNYPPTKYGYKLEIMPTNAHSYTI
jgi:beta-lactamase superfamily II metal-dependent hydrolase